jgi:hypothetical protein
MREDVSQPRCQERIHLNPGTPGKDSLEENTVYRNSMSGEDSDLDPGQEMIQRIHGTLILHVRRGHASILCWHGREHLDR